MLAARTQAQWPACSYQPGYFTHPPPAWSTSPYTQRAPAHEAGNKAVDVQAEPMPRPGVGLR